MKAIPNGHTHLQFAMFSPSQQIEWSNPHPCNKGLISCTTFCEFCFLERVHKWKEKV
jgi:hypothetical protein